VQINFYIYCITVCNKRINEKYNCISETGDKISVSRPQEEIIDKGAFIYYAKLDNNIVGTILLLKKTNDIYEIEKIGVSESDQGLGVGTILLEHCLQISQHKKVSKLILYSNTILKSAMHLYSKYGFLESKLEEGLYKRANIKMKKV